MPDAGVAPAIYSARPVFRISDREEPGLSELLLSLRVQETSDGLYWCEATFANFGPTAGAVDFLLFNRRILDFGKEMAIVLGADERAGPVFRGRISAIEGRFLEDRAPEMLVLAEDRLQDLRLTRRTRSFENIADRELFERIASEHGLRAEVDVPGPQRRTVAQLNQSDLAFLRDRARLVDAELWVEDRVLKAVSRARRGGTPVTLTHGEGLREFSVVADLSEQCSGFRVAGWDVAAKNGISHQADRSALGAELNGGLSGSELLDQALGARRQQTVHQQPLTQEEARLLAEARYRGVARRFVSGQGRAEGDPRLRVGMRVRLDRLGPLFEGEYQVTRVDHVFDTAHGYETLFEVERGWIGRG